MTKKPAGRIAKISPSQIEAAKALRDMNGQQKDLFKVLNEMYHGLANTSLDWVVKFGRTAGQSRDEQLMSSDEDVTITRLAAALEMSRSELTRLIRAADMIDDDDLIYLKGANGQRAGANSVRAVMKGHVFAILDRCGGKREEFWRMMRIVVEEGLTLEDIRGRFPSEELLERKKQALANMPSAIAQASENVSARAIDFTKLMDEFGGFLDEKKTVKDLADESARSAAEAAAKRLRDVEEMVGERAGELERLLKIAAGKAAAAPPAKAAPAAPAPAQRAAPHAAAQAEPARQTKPDPTKTRRPV